MTNQPILQPDASAGPPTISVEELLALEQKLRENKAAQLRGDTLPHEISADTLRNAVIAIRRQRGTMNLEKPTKGGGKPKIELLDLDGL